MTALLRNNAGLKLLSVAAAIVSWAAIRTAINFEVAVPDVPLEIRAASGWAIMRQSVGAVRVTFRGAEDDLRVLDAKQVRVVLDLKTNGIAGSGTLEIPLAAVRRPRGVRAVRIEPDRVQVSLDRVADKQVPVKSRTLGKPAGGEVEGLVCDPAVVTLRGPAQLVRQTDWLYTEPIDVDGRIGSFVKRSRVQLPGDAWAATVEPSEVQVNVVLSDRMATAVWDDVPLEVLAPPRPARAVTLTPDRVRVVLTARQDAIEDVRALAPVAFVECRDVDPSLAQQVPVRVHLPPGTRASAAAEPATARVMLSAP